MRALLTGLVLLAVGCTTTHHVRRPDDAEAFQTLALSHGVRGVSVLFPAVTAPRAQNDTDETTAPPSKIVSAPFQSVSPTGPLVITTTGPLQLRLDDVQGFEVSNQLWGVLEGAGWGALVGGMGGATIGYAQGNDPPCGDFCVFRMSATDKAIFNGLAFGAIGAIVGGIVGAFTGHTDQYVF